MADYTVEQRRDMAKNGQAMPDGSYPIANKQDLAKAILTVGLGTNPAAAKAWIIKRARELNALDMLPKAWNITK